MPGLARAGALLALLALCGGAGALEVVASAFGGGWVATWHRALGAPPPRSPENPRESPVIDGLKSITSHTRLHPPKTNLRFRDPLPVAQSALQVDGKVHALKTHSFDEATAAQVDEYDTLEYTDAAQKLEEFRLNVNMPS